ncbi:MAG: DNA replication complex subunit Gins51 [Promethearchaeota archaeon]
MDLKKYYDELYNQWLNEFENDDITPISNELLVNHEKIVKELEELQFNEKNELILELMDVYKKNLVFLLEDLRKIREQKIIVSAFKQQPLNLDNLLEYEIWMYQNLLSIIKSFERMKNLKTIEIGEEIEKQADIIKTTEIEKISQQKLEQATEIDTIKSEESVPTTIKKVDIEYLIVRFLKDTPPLVGTDLKNYGPFNRDDIACLPLKNAIILINEKFAEKIEVT